MIAVRTELKLPRSLQRLEDLPREAARDAMVTARDFLREEVRRNVSKGGPDGLNIRTGTLYRSIRTYLQDTPTGARLSLGGVFYLRVHNEGRVITAKNAPYLRYYIPGIGYRQSKSVRIPRRPVADDAVRALEERFPGMLRQAVRRRFA